MLSQVVLAPAPISSDGAARPLAGTVRELACYHYARHRPSTDEMAVLFSWDPSCFCNNPAFCCGAGLMVRPTAYRTVLRLRYRHERKPHPVWAPIG